MIYFSSVHSILTYGIIFWSNSSYCGNIFGTQKRIIRSRDSGCALLKKNNIYIFLSLFVLKNRELYKSHSDIHSINTRHSTGGLGSSVGVVGIYGLDGLGLNPGWDEIFRPSRLALGPTQPPVMWVLGLSPGVEATRMWG
jgi:hypothetical protein